MHRPFRGAHHHAVEPVDSPSVTRGGTAGVRLLGAGIAAGLAAAVLWLAWTMAHLIDPAGGLGFEAILGGHGIAGGQRLGEIFAWATGPTAAAIAGAASAPAAAIHRARHGVNMGALTYLIAIVIAPLAGLPAMLAPSDLIVPIPLGPALVAVPFLWIGSAIVLAPLLLVCVGAGITWAGLLGIARGPVEAVETRPPSVLFVAILGSFLIVGWVFIAAIFGGLLNAGPNGID